MGVASRKPERRTEMTRTEYGAKVTEIIDAATGGFEYPESFEADVEVCFVKRMTPEAAAEKLMADYATN